MLNKRLGSGPMQLVQCNWIETVKRCHVKVPTYELVGIINVHLFVNKEGIQNASRLSASPIGIKIHMTQWFHGAQISKI